MFYYISFNARLIKHEINSYRFTVNEIVMIAIHHATNITNCILSMATERVCICVYVCVMLYD